MDFLESMAHYYHSEYKAGYFIGSVAAGLLLLTAILLWKFATPFSLVKGLTIPLLIAGIFMGIGGSLSGYYTQKSFPEKVKLYQQNKHDFFKQEVAKAQRTHKSWFGIRLWWTIVAIAGLTVALTAKKDYTIGVGLGILLFGLLGHLEEAISYHRNETYKNAVFKAAEEDRLTQQQSPAPSNTQIPPPSPISRGSKATLKKSVCVAKDSVNTPPASDSLYVAYLNTDYLAKPAPTLLSANSVLKADTIRNNIDISKASMHKHRKMIDYYNSDLIQQDGISSKKCWFNKKYITD